MPPLNPTPDPRTVNVLPSGWKRTSVPSADVKPGGARAAAYVRQDGCEVFFDRRSRPGDPLETNHPGWVWLARRGDGQVLGHGVSSVKGNPGGLFLPRKFKSAFEAMRALDLEVPLSVAATLAIGAGELNPGSSAGALSAALAELESARPDLLGPSGTLLPRMGIAWKQVDFDQPITLAALPLPPGGASFGQPRAAFTTAPAAAAHKCPVVTLRTEESETLRALLQKVVAHPSLAALREVRAFLDLSIHRRGARASVEPTAPPAQTRRMRKRISLQAGRAAAA